jgi:hypothetical protein
MYNNCKKGTLKNSFKIIAFHDQKIRFFKKNEAAEKFLGLCGFFFYYI